jgi:energy-coupling factor transport system permease protein
VHRLHPFTLLAIAIALPALGWILPPVWGPAGSVGIAMGLAVVSPPPSAGGRSGLVRAILFTAAPFWLFLFLLHDRATALTIALRLTTMIASFLWLVAVLSPARLVEGMVAAGWPVTAAFLLSATLRAVPVLRERAGRIVDAQRCRGLSTRGSPLARLRALRALALPLVLSALHEVDERALALETRGLAAGVRRTPLAPPADPTTERIVRWALLVGCLAALAWRLV